MTLDRVALMSFALWFGLLAVSAGCGDSNGNGGADVGTDASGDVTKERITTDAGKVSCGPAGPCSGSRRCYRPGNGDPECENCSGGPSCPEKCSRLCLKRCFVDGTCDNPDEECVDGNAEGARVCLPPL